MFKECVEKGGIKATIAQSLNIDEECQSCINEAKRKSNAKSASRKEGQEG
jgi:hypothetical protein